MNKTIVYPILEGKIAERGIRKKSVAEALNINQRTLGNKLAGKTAFTWDEVVTLQATFFDDVSKDALMVRSGA